jgi:hypothetical protein
MKLANLLLATADMSMTYEFPECFMQRFISRRMFAQTFSQ